ncbi:MAG: carbohydrate binding family 9 domain-containing protein [Ignavibacteria bacterium]|jgi:hypothetical protein|nr:carbohydrate binding family 9 domain-containing protein [Ignavibacteria bacterium]
MKKFTVLLLFCFLYQSGLSALPGTPKQVRAFKAAREIVIDGYLNEQIWQNQAIQDFTQKNPKEGEKASEVTHAWIAYDESYLYIAAKLYDSHPDSIVGRLARRDNQIDSDWFGVGLDPYLDKRTGYFFLINPSETVVDGVFYNDSWQDNSWDGVWYYAARRDDQGWNVEMKIPFSQLRYKYSEQMTWGINLYRNIQRKNEEDYFQMVSKKESGFVSHFPELIGLSGVEKKQRLEILPYVVSRAQYLVHDAQDPFYKQNQYKVSLGGDMKVGLGSNLTLDATFNPDFGQVEVDPAVVNLSAFETFYDEKRPFFIEGSNIFSFGSGGSNNNWGFNWGNPNLFYSRRIGRTPQGEAQDNDYSDFPNETRIIGAAKLTGKIGSGWSVGAVNAVTQRTFAELDLGGVRTQQEVEPLTNYTALRSQKEFNSGNQALGFMFTSVMRSLKDEGLKERLSDHSYVFGLDGWTMLDENNTYVLTGYMAGSYVHGTKDYMISMQESPVRYMQRPDAKYAVLDSNINSMAGFLGRVTLNKQKGNFYVNAAFGAVSPGFEVNDLGYQWRADVINSHVVVGYRWFDPDNFMFRNKQLYAAHFRSYNFDGDALVSGYFVMSDLQFLNYYGMNVQAIYFQRGYHNTLTRGGPIVSNPAGYEIDLSGSTDSRKNVVLNVSGSYSGDEMKSLYRNVSADIEWRPATQATFSIGPSVSTVSENLQWIDNFSDPVAVNTYGTRYVFGKMKQTTVSANIRLNWTFTPTLSLQVFMQPLISTGKFTDFKELSAPRSLSYRTYEASQVSYDKENNQYTVKPDKNAEAFTFDNPDFNFKSLRGNVVLRWEFMAGSSLYLVWTQSKLNEDNPGDMSFRRDFTNLLNAQPDNIFLLKFAYWLNY